MSVVAAAVPPIDIMIAGTQKGGTSTLAALLERGPGVVSHSSLEFPYFVDEEWFDLGYEAAFRRSYGSRPAEGVVVAKSAGVMYLDPASRRLVAACPDVRVVVVLRDPVDRAYSAYWFLRRVGREDAPTFEEALALEHDRLRSDRPNAHLFAYRDRGCYVGQLERLADRVGADRLSVVLFDDLARDPGRVGREVGAWAGVGVHDVDQELVGARNASALPRSASVTRLLHRPPPVLRRAVNLLPDTTRNRWRLRLQGANEREWRPPPMASDTRQRLQAEMSGEVDALERWLGRDLGAWR